MSAARCLIVTRFLALWGNRVRAEKENKPAEQPYWPGQLARTRAVVPEQESTDSCGQIQRLTRGDIVNPARADMTGDQDGFRPVPPDGIPVINGILDLRVGESCVLDPEPRHSARHPDGDLRSAQGHPFSYRDCQWRRTVCEGC